MYIISLYYYVWDIIINLNNKKFYMKRKKKGNELCKIK